MVKIADITWQVSKNVRDIAPSLYKNKSLYDQDKDNLKEFMCRYFNSTKGCIDKLSTIIPMGKTQKGGKCLKVKWRYLGSGKSGGIRLPVVAYCEHKKVIILDIFIRKDDPTDTEYQESFDSADKIL